MNQRQHPVPTFDCEARWALRAGLAALPVGAAFALLAPTPFFYGYLSAFILWAGLPLGCLAVLMLHHLVGGAWGTAVRPLLAAAGVSTMVLVVLFVPVALGMGVLYHWVNPGERVPELLAKKSAYLNVGFFLIRALGFFIVWTVLGWLFFGARERPQTSRPGMAAAGLILYFLTITFAAIDWLGSLHYEWYSSVLGLYLAASQACTAFACLVLAAVWLNRTFPAELPVSKNVLQDLSNLLFAFVVLHTYLAYAQYFIIWNGNLPHEVEWYVPRIHGYWGDFAVILLIFDFGIPFLALLSRDVKRNPKAMVCVAATVLFARALEAIWLVIPAHDESALASVALMVLAAIALGGFWSTFFLRVWRRGPLFTSPHHAAEAST